MTNNRNEIDVESAAVVDEWTWNGQVTRRQLEIFSFEVNRKSTVPFHPTLSKHMSLSASWASFADLPTEILLLILNDLHIRDLFSLSSVSQRLHYVSLSLWCWMGLVYPVLWRRRFA